MGEWRRDGHVMGLSSTFRQFPHRGLYVRAEFKADWPFTKENVQSLALRRLTSPPSPPVSPILFLLYIRNLLIKIDRRNTVIPSHIDDIAIITRSKSIAVNNVILKGTAEKLMEEGKN
jgi:hypothetical protein